jgi:C4-dicarboxylate-specific signal transduction histidine kinase
LETDRTAAADHTYRIAPVVNFCVFTMTITIFFTKILRLLIVVTEQRSSERNLKRQITDRRDDISFVDHFLVLEYFS